MKKCFTLALLLMAVMAISISPVSATAPLISNLPRIVLADDTGDDTFLNALNLDVYINWHPGGDTNQDYGPADFRVYLYDPSTSRSLILFALTSQTLDTLVNDPFTDPAIANGYSGSTTSTNWLSITYLDHSGVDLTGDVTLVAGVVDGNGKTTSSAANMEVVTNSATGKDNTPWTRRQTSDQDIDALTDGWHNSVKELAGSYNTVAVIPGKIGYNCGTAANKDGALGAGVNFGYGAMISGDGQYDPLDPARTKGGFLPSEVGIFMVPHNGEDFDATNVGVTNPAFELKATFTSTAPNPEDSAGYRLGFQNAANSHFGYMTYLFGTQKSATDGYTTGINTPSVTTGEHVMDLYWAVPVGASGMENNGIAGANQIGAFTSADFAADGRDYGLEFNVVDNPGNFGDFILEAISIRTFSLDDITADGTVAPKVFTSFGSWVGTVLNPVAFPGWADGTMVVSGANLRLTCPAPSAISMIIATPPLANSYKVVPGTLLRSQIVAKSQSVDTCPILRLLLIVQALDDTGILLRDRQYFMEEHWGAVSELYKNPTLKPAGAENPGVPQTTNTSFTSFMRVADGAQETAQSFTNDRVVPQVQAYKRGVHGGTSQWTDETGGLDLVSITLDVVAE